MKFIKLINEYLSDNKETYVKWVSNSIIKDIKKSNIELDDFHIEYGGNMIFYIKFSDSEIEIKKTKQIIKKWKKYSLENDNLILMYRYVDFIGDNTAKFFINYKSLKIKRVKPLKYVYHQTKPEYIKSILKNGLIPKDSSEWEKEDYHLEYPPSIFVNNIEIENITNMFHSSTNEYVILKIDTSKISNKWYADLNLTTNNYVKISNPIKYIMTFEPIPALAIEVIEL